MFLIIITFLQFYVNVSANFCGYPGRPTNGTVRYTFDVTMQHVFYTDATVSYVCNSHCRRTGSRRRTCKSDGRWTGHVPICDCPLMDLQTSQSSTSEEKASINQNNTAITAIDPNHSSCSLTKEEPTPWWSASWNISSYINDVIIETALDDFEQLDLRIGHGHYWITCSLSKKDNNNKRLVYNCPTNIATNNIMVIKGANGRNTSLSLCTVDVYLVKVHDCGLPELPLDTSYKKVGSTYIYRCTNGFHLSHTKPLICRINGTWNIEAPRCQAPICQGHDGLKNGNVSHEIQNKDGSAKQGTSLQITCNYGYEKAHNKSIVCGNDGKWNDSVHCIGVSCDSPKMVQNGFVIFDDDKFTSIAAIKCSTGYEVKGSKDYITCQGNKKWSSPVPECIVIDCGEPLITKNNHLKFVSNKTTYGSKFAVMCEANPSRKNLLFYCNEMGKWNITRYPCEAQQKEKQQNIFLFIGIAFTLFVIIIIILVIFSWFCRGYREGCVNICKDYVSKDGTNGGKRESNNILVINDYTVRMNSVTEESQVERDANDFSEHIYTELEELQQEEEFYHEPEFLTHYAVTPIDKIANDASNADRTLTSSYQIANHAAQNTPFVSYDKSIRKKFIENLYVGDNAVDYQDNAIYE